jgi:o-succinylbenzoate synthase
MEDLPFVFHYKAYEIPLAQAIWLGQVQTKKRTILHLRLEIAGKGFVFSEVAPLAELGSETMDAALSFCKSFSGKKYTLKALLPSLSGLPACQLALESALHQAIKPLDKIAQGAQASFETAALLFPSLKTIHELQDLLNQGFKNFKLKIGILSFEEEKSMIEAILKRLNSIGGSLRLDANGRFCMESSKYYLDFLDTIPIEFLEQPLAPGQEDPMLSLAAQYQTAIAWDESITSLEGIRAAAAKGFQGVYVIKPSLLGSLSQFLSWRAANPDKTIVYSSAFESSLGIDLILSLAASHAQSRGLLPLGLGTLAYYKPSPLLWHSFGPRLSYKPHFSQHRSALLWDKP